MNKLSLSLAAASAFALAGIASAQTFNSPMHQPGEASTMTMGAPNMLTHNRQDHGPLPAPVVENLDTTVLGGPSSSVMWYAPMVPVPPYVHYSGFDFHGSATNSSSVPDRAGELSTISGGAPNMMP